MAHVHHFTRLLGKFYLGVRAVLPGVGLCVAVSAAAYAVEASEVAFLGEAWLEALVLAIVIGTGVRSLWSPGPRWQAGIDFSAKYLLEIAVVLLGASVSAAMITGAGLGLLIGISGVVTVSILVSFGIGKILHLPTRMALLIACGNSICGNSAIAAVAPVIGADSDDVAASIAFTAVLGVVVCSPCQLSGLPWALQTPPMARLPGSPSMPFLRSSLRRRRWGQPQSRWVRWSSSSGC